MNPLPDGLTVNRAATALHHARSPESVGKM